MSIIQEITEANTTYAENFQRKGLGSLPLPPSRKLTVVTCMDARIDPAASLGIKEGEAHIIRNAGGSARDALRSILISQHLLGTTDIAIFHHTDCGMLTFTTEQFQSLLKDKHPAKSKDIESIDFLTFPDLEQDVKSNVEFIKSHPLVLNKSNVTGWIYEVETGKIRQVV